MLRILNVKKALEVLCNVFEGREAAAYLLYKFYNCRSLKNI